jgi:hypothetical protein
MMEQPYTTGQSFIGVKPVEDQLWSEREIVKACLDRISEYMVGGIIRYVEQGVPTGSFLLAVFSNDFYSAVSHADSTNIGDFKCYLDIIQVMPWQSWGSAKEVKAWVDQGGEIGRKKANGEQSGY